MHNYPEQNDIIVTNVLSLFGLDKDGNDSSVSKDAAEDTISEDAKEKLRCAFVSLPLVTNPQAAVTERKP